MCGRTACTLAPTEICQACARKIPSPDEDDGNFELPEWREHPGGPKYEYRTKFNFGPSIFAPIMVSGVHFGLDADTRVIQPMHWGLIPSWHKNENFRSHGLTTINCRHETLLQKPLFSKPLKQNRRGVLVCDGYYEWRRKDGSKQPYYFFFRQPKEEFIPGDPNWKSHVKTEWDSETGWHGPRPLTVAVVFDMWHPPVEDDNHPEIHSFSVITVPADKTVEFVHDRMPAILPDDEIVEKWLDPHMESKEAVKLLHPYGDLAYHKVATVCNNIHNDSVACVRPLNESTMKVGNQATLFSFFKKKTVVKEEGGGVKRAAEETAEVKVEASPEKKLKK